MNINLELYKVFYAVANNKSMTKAAEELAVSQPAITKSIKTLEEQLGGTLFIRSNKGLELTSEGKTFYEKIKIALSFIHDAETTFGDFKDLKLGEVRIGVSSVLTKVILTDKIKKYRDLYPGVKISIINGLTSDLIYQLNKGKLDFVIYNEGDVKESNVDIENIGTLKYVFAYNPDFYDLEDVKTFKDLQKYPLILQNTNSNTRKFLNAFLKKNNIELEVKMEVVSQDLICELINNGSGVGFVLSELIDKNYKNLKKVTINEELNTEVYVAKNKDLQPTFAAKKFLDLI